MKDPFKKVILLFTVFVCTGCFVYLVVPVTMSDHIGLEKISSVSGNYFNDVSLCLLVIALSNFVLFFYLRKSRVLFFNLSLFFLLLCLTEVYFSYRAVHFDVRRHLNLTTSGNSYMPSDILGYSLFQSTVNETEYLDTICVYNVQYTVDNTGCRITAPMSINSSDTASSIVFFGCSYTFGMGLNDDQTMPYIVQNYVKDKYKVYNLGVSGYGPNQMLAAIENQLLDSIVNGKPKIFIFTALTDHINRVFSLYLKERRQEHVPKYFIDNKTNQLKYAGLYDSPENMIENRWFSKILKSKISGYISNRVIDKRNAKLIIALITKSKKILLQKYPGSQFHVLYWNEKGNANDTMIINGLKENKMDVHLTSDILPGYSSGKFPLYMIRYPYEFHPSYQANKLLSDYLVSKIIGENDAEYLKVKQKPYTDQFDRLDNYYWSIQSYSFPLNDCEMLPSQVKCNNSILTLTIEENRMSNKSENAASIKMINLKKDSTSEKKNFKGGGVYTTNFFRYGEFTACLKNTGTSGTVSFFTLMNKWKAGEWIQKDIDFALLGKSPRQVLVSIKINNKDKPVSYGRTYNLNFNSSESFHTYTILWTKDSISFKVDGKLLGSEKEIKIDDEMNILFNHWTVPQNDINLTGWSGKIDRKKLPSEFKVNYVSYKPLSE